MSEAIGIKCLIIAAGKGSRLQQRGDSKPLITILGIPLIERVIRAAMEAGADEFYVVIGHQGERVRNFLRRLADRLAIRITPLLNDDWEKENGLSVLKARDVLHEPFLLLMADHLFDPKLIRPLTTLTLDDGEIGKGVSVDGLTAASFLSLLSLPPSSVPWSQVRRSVGTPPSPVEDSSNSSGVAIDYIRCNKPALDCGQSGILIALSACFCEHPPKQFSDDEVYTMTEVFIQKK